MTLPRTVTPHDASLPPSMKAASRTWPRAELDVSTAFRTSGTSFSTHRWAMLPNARAALNFSAAVEGAARMASRKGKTDGRYGWKDGNAETEIVCKAPRHSQIAPFLPSRPKSPRNPRLIIAEICAAKGETTFSGKCCTCRTAEARVHVLRGLGVGRVSASRIESTVARSSRSRVSAECDDIQ